MKTTAILALALLAGCAAKPTAVSVIESHDVGGHPQITARCDGDTLYVDAISPRGIGHARIQLDSGVWPARLTLHPRYSDRNPFANLEGFSARLETPGVTGQSAPAGQTEPLPTDIRADPNGAIVAEAGPIPQTDKTVLYVEWVDWYR
jgi:hypothetical protein